MGPFIKTVNTVPIPNGACRIYERTKTIDNKQVLIIPIQTLGNFLPMAI